MTAKSLWIGDEPLILASTSRTRRTLLEGAGVPFEVEQPGVDERAIEAPHLARGVPPGERALLLAREKALAVSSRRMGRLVLGADQTLACDGRSFVKPADRAAAHAQLAALAGRTHHLYSAAAIACDGAILFETVTIASLTMRRLDDSFIERYIAAAGDAVTASVGAYQLEGLGVQLFAGIEGDHFTILGLPLLQVLEALRSEGVLAA